MANPKLDDDELDDLDDFLDEFADDILSKPPGADLKPQPITTAQPETESTSAKDVSGIKASSEAKTGPLAQEDDLLPPELDEEMARKLQAGMNDILKELDGSPDSKVEFEKLLAEMANMTLPGSAASKGTGVEPGVIREPTKAKPDQFQDTISQTMNRLNESKQEIDQQVAEDDDGDFLAKMLQELGTASGAGDGNLDMNKLLLDMLEQLSSKEILYEPMKEMHEKYPGWLHKNSASLPKDELDRYLNQQRIVSEVILKFEERSYDDDNPVHRKYIAARMEEMQNSGAPPSELMGDVAGGGIPGLSMDESGMPKLPEDLDNCGVQ